MIVVRIELWPYGDSRSLMALEELTIVNIGTAEGSRCRYEARLGAAVALLVHDPEDGPVDLATAALNALSSVGLASRAKGRRINHTVATADAEVRGTPP